MRASLGWGYGKSGLLLGVLRDPSTLEGTWATPRKCEDTRTQVHGLF